MTHPTQDEKPSPEKVTDRHLKNATDGKLRVAPGLYFIARKGRRPYWEFRYTPNGHGKQRSMTLGQYPDLGLKEARERAATMRQEVKDGIDPIEAREAQRRAAEKELAAQVTLREAAGEVHELLKPTWRNAKHANQWLQSLNHLGDSILDRPITDITSADLLAPLEALNAQHHDTAIRVRQRVEAIYDRARLQGIVSDNPAAALGRFLKKPVATKHHAAIDYRELPGFLADLRDSDCSQSTRLAFEWLILSGARTEQVRMATWDQIKDGIWMPSTNEPENKKRSPCPLTWRMHQILHAIDAQRGDGWNWIFPSPHDRRRPLSDGAFLAAVRRMGRAGELTPHGMRAALSTWAYETQDIRSDVIEAALGHNEKNAVKAAYSRADYLDQRIALAEAWTTFCCPDFMQENSV